MVGEEWFCRSHCSIAFGISTTVASFVHSSIVVLVMLLFILCIKNHIRHDLVLLLTINCGIAVVSASAWEFYCFACDDKMLVWPTVFDSKDIKTTTIPRRRRRLPRPRDRPI